MAKNRYLNLQTTQNKWKKSYYGDFFIANTIGGGPVFNYYEIQECSGPLVDFIKTYQTLNVGEGIVYDGRCWEVFSVESALLSTEFAGTVYADCATCQSQFVSPTPTPTTTSTPTPSVTPSITPTVTPSASSVVPSSTPSVTPTSSITPTPTTTPAASSTPTPTPTPSSTPPEQFFLLAENSDELLTEFGVNLVVESATTQSVQSVIAVYQFNTPGVIYYSNGDSSFNQATVANLGYPQAFHDVMYDGTNWIAVGSTATGATESARIMTSSDGTNFAEVSLNNLGTLQGDSMAIGWNGSYYVIAGNDSTLENRLLKSTNLVNWSAATSIDGSSSSVYVDVSWDGSTWWTMDSTGRIKKSTDGTTWDDVGNDSTNFIQGQGVESNGSTILAYGDPDSASDVGIQYSTNNGVSWSDSDLTDIRINAVAWNGTRWVAAGYLTGSDANLYHSTNGSTWTEAANVGVSQQYTDVSWNGSYFIAVGTSSGDDVVISQDGINWVVTDGTGNNNDSSVFTYPNPQIFPPIT